MNSPSQEKDFSLLPVKPDFNPGLQYASESRLWQGIPSIERSQSGRLWATFFSGGVKEPEIENYVLLIRSDDDGITWSKPLLVVDPPGRVRALDSCLWFDPQGTLWFFWTQCYDKFDGRYGVWAITTANSDDDRPEWSEPRRICNGVMNNKPTVLSSGEWLLPISMWSHIPSEFNDLPDEKFSLVYCSEDNGASFYLRGKADVPGRTHDEHILVERLDGSLWMLVRTVAKLGGIGESVSLDRGRTWSPGTPSTLTGPGSRFFVRRLQSGRLLLVNHYGFVGRSHMTAMLSDDDGNTWFGFLVLDERKDGSYPAAVQAEDGTIYVIYDRERYKDREILLAVFTEEDVANGQCLSPLARLKVLVDRATTPLEGKQ
jgi:hypothetical protein